MTVKNGVQLITYPDSLGGDLRGLELLLDGPLDGLFPGGVHILPPFPSSGDRGFAPLTYRKIDPRFGAWDDMRRIGERHPVLVDLMVNHISRQSPYFQDFLRKGRRSEHADLFITLDKIWPGGVPQPEDVARIFLRRPRDPFSSITITETGEQETIWTTFGRQDPSEQIDLDVHSAATRRLLANDLAFFRSQNVSIVRLDAVGYVIKKPGTTCFMVEPEIYGFLDWITSIAEPLGLELLPEVHAVSSVQARLAAHGCWVYDFVLPLLVLHTLLSGSSGKLAEYLKTCPRKQFTTLDTHDGIPVQPDLTGHLSIDEMAAVVDHCLGRGANLSRIFSARGDAPEFDAHQINCTYFSALAAEADAYLVARAIQFFAPGVPQVYYVGLLAGENDEQAVEITGEGRAINRHNYSAEEVESALRAPVVERLVRLIRFRNEHPAFGGDLRVVDSVEDELDLERRYGAAIARLRVNLVARDAAISYTAADGETKEYVVA